jgi:hypothetical protein
MPLFGRRSRDNGPIDNTTTPPSPPPRATTPPRRNGTINGTGNGTANGGGGFFNRNKAVNDPPVNNTVDDTNNNVNRNGSFFNRNKRGSVDNHDGAINNTATPATSTSTRSRSLFRRNTGPNPLFDNDQSVVNARNGLRAAEEAEVEADRALEAAKARVREAHEHVRRLEKEANEQ